jgi:nanoRNase/pAp phosphatase (c-di-AMP/oligoRNAs hydrolase)
MKDTGKLKEAISNRLLKGGRIGITTHIAPDGDGFCAALGLQALFKAKSIASEIVIDDTNLERFSFLMADANLVRYASGKVKANIRCAIKRKMLKNSRIWGFK